MRATSRRTLVSAALFGIGCASARGPAASSSVCAPAPTSSSATSASAPAVPTNGLPIPAVLCDHLRALLVGGGAGEEDLEDFDDDCLTELTEAREDDPQTYACEARCFTIVPGPSAIEGCEEICAHDAADACKEWRADDGTVSDTATAGCRDRFGRIRATTDDKTMLCALACVSMGRSVRATDECFSRCLSG